MSLCATRGIDSKKKKKKKDPFGMGSILAKPVEPSCQTDVCLHQKSEQGSFLSEALSFPRGTELQTVRDAKNTTVAEHAVSTLEHRVERSGRILSHS